MTRLAKPARSKRLTSHRPVIECSQELQSYEEDALMNCYVCALENVTSASVSICRHCSVAMCLKHAREAQSHSVGGTRYDCPHTLTTADAR